MLRYRSFVLAVTLSAILGMWLTPTVRAAVLTVPGDFSTIQECIDAAVSGVDECLVSPGAYNEVINFLGKAIILRSSDGAAVTTIDGTGLNDSVVKCISGEGSDTVLDGFTITGGTGDPSVFGASSTIGGGMRNDGTSPTVRNCAFIGNTATLAGGGMYNGNSSNPTVTECTFSGNWGQNRGGGMSIEESTATVTDSRFIGNSSEDQAGAIYDVSNAGPVTSTFTNCVFVGNTVVGGFFGGVGGAILSSNGSSPILVNCAFVGNTAPSTGGAMYIGDNFSGDTTLGNCTFVANSVGGSGGGIFSLTGEASVSNSIFWFNSDSGGIDESAQIHVSSGAPVVTYTDIQGLVPGGAFDSGANTNNINADPLFVDADGADNIPGTEDDNLRLLTGSPVIDAADNTAVPPDTADLDDDNDTTEPTPLDLDRNPRFVDDPATPDTGNPGPPGTIVDMGAYEFQVAGEPIPTVSEWGLVAMALLILAAGTIVFMRRRTNSQGGFDPPLE